MDLRDCCPIESQWKHEIKVHIIVRRVSFFLLSKPHDNKSIP